MSGPEDYTIGWICALPIEYAAAQLFLDKTHDPLESIAPGDNNGYTLGKMGQHNVVLTVLPDTEYGTASAATAVTDMTRSFPNIRICLMVGIGGGVPSSTNDVRLGDVVVGTHIIQYDFGKTVQGQTFQETKHLNKPPRMLLTAVNGLKAKYLSEGHQIADRIESILKDRKSTKEAKRLQKHFGQPGADSDRLFIPDYVHPTDHDDRPCECGAVGGLESKNLMERPARDDDDDFPLIHFGPIASGNQVMKDALIRDNYGRSKEVLCFEMEAAGLMNNFPCLVIRGISDYADSHKNDRWKGFAAMTAAGYAKDLLGFVLPSSIREAPKLQEILVTLKTSRK
ncbi:purine and uridine phosphorylase [Ascobolus immersus RN42]|uniref:Purine and uridine phosphorylase n=1 Tax=Ascobolus immersus RN42 TaxID=1160509 RepID=A0A3N4I3X5_ASCIM|nr:purine and uridine phosphorylase [Ascobolus immersus RN42]